MERFPIRVMVTSHARVLTLLGMILFAVWFYFESNQMNVNTPIHIPNYKEFENFKHNVVEPQKPNICLRDILLAINYNFPHYDSVNLLREFYQPVFGEVVICGEKEDKQLRVIRVPENKGYQGYACVVTAMKLFPNFTGYIHSNDDVILNWWNLVKFDKQQIWTGTKVVFQGHKMGEPPPPWHWWRTVGAAKLCEKSFFELEALLNTTEGKALKLANYFRRYYNNTKNKKICVNGWSDFFYIPAHLAKTYMKINEVFLKNQLFLEVAVPMSLTFLMNKSNSINLKGMYYNSLYGYSKKYLTGEAFYETYSLSLNFSHPFKLDGEMKVANRKMFKDVVMVYGKTVRKDCWHV